MWIYCFLFIFIIYISWDIIKNFKNYKFIFVIKFINILKGAGINLCCTVFIVMCPYVLNLNCLKSNTTLLYDLINKDGTYFGNIL